MKGILKMSKIIISTDSTCDLPKELIEKYDIKVLPLNIVSDTESKKDGIEIKTKDVFDYQKTTGKLLKTAAANLAEWEDFFDGLPENDGVINFTISGEMSSTFMNSKLAAEERENIYTVDSQNLSTGIGLLILTACDLREQGLFAKEIYEKIEATKPLVRSSFVLDTLEFLHKGGRCSAVAALGANLLKLKPCIEVENGKMDAAKKYRGKLDFVIESADKLTMNVVGRTNKSLVQQAGHSQLPRHCRTNSSLTKTGKSEQRKKPYQPNKSKYKQDNHSKKSKSKRPAYNRHDIDLSYEE